MCTLVPQSDAGEHHAKLVRDNIAYSASELHLTILGDQ